MAEKGSESAALREQLDDREQDVKILIAERVRYREALRSLCREWDAFTGSDASRERVMDALAMAREALDG